MKKAFTLIELSIVLAIIAIIGGNLLSIATDRSETDKVKETEIILDKIEQAISDYFTEYGSIPCPGDATINQNNANFGIATRHPSYKYYCTGTSSMWYFTSAYDSYDLGIVPTKELKIPDELAFDAWGRRITYVMIEPCNASSNIFTGGNTSITNPNYDSTNIPNIHNFSKSCAFPNKNSTSFSGDGSNSDSKTFKIRDASGTIINPDAGIPYVLISHGKNGHGAYPHNGGNTRINAAAQNTGTTAYNLSADEIQNARMNVDGSNIVFNSGIYIQKSPIYSSGNNYFDDIVRYKTKEQLIRNSGRFIAQNSLADSTGIFVNSYVTNICQLAGSVNTNINNNSNYYCNDSGAYDVCSQYLLLMAIQLKNLCS